MRSEPCQADFTESLFIILVMRTLPVNLRAGRELGCTGVFEFLPCSVQFVNCEIVVQDFRTL